jgi:hypothetical protein
MTKYAKMPDAKEAACPPSRPAINYSNRSSGRHLRQSDEANAMRAGPPACSELIDTTLPSDVLDHCARRGNVAHLQTAIRLAVEHFKTIRKVEFWIQLDPDSDDQRVIVDLSIDGENKEVLASQHAFYRAWAKSVPPLQQDAIRLLYSFV